MLELAVVVTPLRADGWPVPRREQGWGGVGRAQLQGCTPPPPLPEELAHSLQPGRGIPRAAASYEVCLVWRRSSVPVATRRMRRASPGCGSIALDCVALAVEWQAVVECEEAQEASFMLWLDRRNPGGQ